MQESVDGVLPPSCIQNDRSLKPAQFEGGAERIQIESAPCGGRTAGAVSIEIDDPNATETVREFDHAGQRVVTCRQP